jgi:alkylation response protein AidB-like acyl-CoA dehydrogenase
MLSAPLLLELAQAARQADEVPLWPERSWEILKRIGAVRWSVPREYGGDKCSGVELLERYEALASSCLTSCFILSQRDAAVRRLRGSGNEQLCADLLPPLASGDHFATVGLAQLTTSRQFGKPAVIARWESDGFIIDGTIPWVTGAARAEHILIGAVVEGAGQILAVLPTNTPGVRVGPPAELMALQGSLTAEVCCDGVRLDKKWLLAGPAERVVQIGQGGTGGLETSCLALGLAGAAIAHLFTEAEKRPELADDARRLDETRQQLRQELYRLAGGGTDAGAAQSLRARANTFVLQATQAALTASKGTGFLRDHPAQRWARQALFFLVWSCPAPVAAAHMAFFTQVCS